MLASELNNCVKVMITPVLVCILEHIAVPSLSMAACKESSAGCNGRRNEGKSAQEVSQQLKEPGKSWLDRTTCSLGQTIHHDATLESWQEFYRAVPALDWGGGPPVAVAALKQVLIQPRAIHNLRLCLMIASVILVEPLVCWAGCVVSCVQK